MSYCKWNDLLVRHFFGQTDKEIILYIDEDILNQIGESENLDFNDFLESVLDCVENRFAIYDSVINSPRRDTLINRRLSGDIMKMPWILANPNDLENPKVDSRYDLPFFNFVVLAIIWIGRA
ncbi:hypothetical protein [Yeosuana sp. AK3]